MYARVDKALRRHPDSRRGDRSRAVGCPALPRRHALFYGPAAFRSLSLPKGAAPLTKPSKANAVTNVLARVGMAEPQRVSPKPSLAPLAVIPAHHHVIPARNHVIPARNHVIPAKAGISLLVPRVSAPTRPLGVKLGRKRLVSPRSHLKVAMTTKATNCHGNSSCQVVKARQHDSLRRVAYGSRGNDRCREIASVGKNVFTASFFVENLLYYAYHTHWASMRQRIAYFGEFFCM